MSGPKTSRYTLTPEQKRQLREQRERERRKAVALKQIKQSSERLRQIKGMFHDDCETAADMMQHLGDDGGFSSQYHMLHCMIDSAISMVEESDPDHVDTLEKSNDTVRDVVNKAEQIVRELSKCSVKNEYALKKNLRMKLDQGFVTSFADEQPIKSSMEERKDTYRQTLSEMKKDDILPETLRKEINVAMENLDDIHDLEFLNNFAALSITPIIKKCNRYIEEYRECHEEFTLLYGEYTALCELYGYNTNEYECSKTAVEELKTEIKRMKEEAEHDDEQNYIRKCLDEVMEEMGYSMIGSREVMKKSGAHFRNELYTYGEGTAVNITYSTDGRIAMELGGVDTTDRLPDEQETDVLCDAMEQFCTDFQEVEERLAKKGIVSVQRISLLPPDAQYAQIINCSDYEMKTSAQRLQANHHHRVAKRRQVMKRER